MKDFKEFLVESIWDSPEMFPKIKPTEERKKYAFEIWTKVMHAVWDKSMLSMKRIASIRNVRKVPDGIIAEIEDKNVKGGFKEYYFKYTYDRPEFSSLSAKVLLPLDDNSKRVSEILRRNMWKYVKANDALGDNKFNFGAVKQNVPEYVNGEPYYLFHLKSYFKDREE